MGDSGLGSDGRYRTEMEAEPGLSKAPEASGMVATAAKDRAKMFPSTLSALLDKEGRKLDLMGKKEYSSGVTVAKMANMQILMDNFQHGQLKKMVEFSPDLLPLQREPGQ